MSRLDGLPPGFDTEPLNEIVGTGGPEGYQVSQPPVSGNNTVFVNTGYTIGMESYQVLPTNRNRRYLLIQNKSGGNIFFSFGNKADTYNGAIIEAGGNYEPYIYPSTSLHIIASLAGSDIVVIEGYGN